MNRNMNTTMKNVNMNITSDIHTETHKNLHASMKVNANMNANIGIHMYIYIYMNLDTKMTLTTNLNMHKLTHIDAGLPSGDRPRPPEEGLLEDRSDAALTQQTLFSKRSERSSCRSRVVTKDPDIYIYMYTYMVDTIWYIL